MGDTLKLELSASTWDLGQVAEGGVADTWLGQNPHGKFWVRNTGDTNAYIFVVAEPDFEAPGGTLIPDVRFPADGEFGMAIATNITDVLADWKIFDQEYDVGTGMYPGRYVRPLVPGDYFLFDLRFYAGMGTGEGTRNFRVGVYAASGETL